jgi:hypothetical protein
VSEERMKEEMDDIDARAWFAKYRYFTPKAMEIIEELSDEMVRMSPKRLPVVFGWYTSERGRGGDSDQPASRCPIS